MSVSFVLNGGAYSFKILDCATLRCYIFKCAALTLLQLNHLIHHSVALVYDLQATTKWYAAELY